MLFDVAMLPTGNRAITRFEELVVWAALALQDSNTVTYIPRKDTEAELLASVQIGYDFNKVLRAVSTIAPVVTNGWNGSQGTPLWKNVANISNNAVPEDYTG